MTTTKKTLIAALLIFILATIFGPSLLNRWSTSTSDCLVVLKTLNNPYYVEMKRGVDLATSPDSLRIIVEDFGREDDVEGQMSVINEALANQSLAAVCLAPASSSELIGMIKKLNTEKIPIVIIDTRMDEQVLKAGGAHIDGFVGSNNELGGKLAAKYLGENIAKVEASVLFLEGVPSQYTAQARKKGFMSVVSSEYKSWNVETQVADWNREQARIATDIVIQKLGNPPDAIFASNDEMALGAIASLEARNTPPDAWPLIVGFDATPDALRAIREGKMAKTVEQQPDEMGRIAVGMAITLVSGKTPKSPEIEIDVELVP